MESDGTRDARGTEANPVPRPARPADAATAPGGGSSASYEGIPAPYERGAVPPRPTRAPDATPPAPAAHPGYAPQPGQPGQPGQSGSPVADWLDDPRPAAEPGIWRHRYRLPKAARQEKRLAPVTVVGFLVPLAAGLLLWSLWKQGSIPYQWALLRLLTPSDWWWGGTTSPKGYQGAEAITVAGGVFFAILVYAMARLGSWADIISHLVTSRAQPARALLAAFGVLVTLALVFPSTFGLGWDALPVQDPLFSLVVLITGDYAVFASQPLTYGLYALITLLVLWPFARIGGWWALLKDAVAARERAKTADAAARPVTDRKPSQWPDLREAGQHEAADVLTAALRAGHMNDVDYVRIGGMWTSARAEARIPSFTATVLRDGAAAWTHPSGQRDLPGREGRHDLPAGQVRIGRWTQGDRTPLAYGGAGAALGPETLATSLLAVGPAGSGKTRHLVRPVVESLGLYALAGRCAVVVVCAAGTPLGPDSAYDVVVRLGDPTSVHDLDPYAESRDPDEAAAFLAEGLAGDLDPTGGARAVTALAQLLGPYRAAYGRFPTLPVLRELLEGEPEAMSALRAALASEEHSVMRRELDARARQSGSAGDPGPMLADRLAVLDRPALAAFFGADERQARPFSLRAVAHHPLRVRVDLPERGHEDAARIVTRLLLAQFDAVVSVGGRSHFACLVLDDAAAAVTSESVRRIQRLRSRNAGVVLALRTVGDVPEPLHGQLYAAVGCRMAFSGVTTWDGGRFAEAWGTQWVETKDVAQHTVFADQPMTRLIHALRKLATGKAVTTEAITVRQVERERWSASELAHGVPPGHAVLSLTTVRGEHAPPLLVDLRG
ncbi:ATP/GTP-binding protein [Streptomyces sp. SID4982]|uniref:ATP/GTP-binding protein n=1 Tax=Streptomyces sp. SID4982 TaxID=2690291 RepID=UPI00136F6DA0|nr:ATP/GTP-binding protein [Streptomyces sp. SID4982]MYS16489.1 ATP/GTP-binding protein [Streptomyces sp. SID4982]